MPKTALVINTNAEVSLVDFSKDSLKVLQTAVDGLIQPVDLDGNVTMWVNEEGLFRSDLAVNPIATGIYTQMYDIENPIIGDVVFTGGTDSEGNTLPLGEEEIRVLTEVAENYRRVLSQFA
jgi:hypothetical protein